ncbi:MAG: PAS domain-containing protein [Anaerolineae bacterium]|nr:PAS domain-containing protein [Anaerolineae bacterium]
MSADHTPHEALGTQRQTEEQLRGYERTVSTLADPVAFVSRDYVYLMVNEAYQRYAGQSKEQIVGHTVAELHGEREFEELIRPRLDHCLAGHAIQYQDWFDTPTLGRRFMDVRYTPVNDDDGVVIGAAVHSRDLTSRREMETSLRREHSLVTEIMETSPVGIVVLDRDGRIRFVNAQVERLTGLTREQIHQAEHCDPRWPTLDENGQPLPAAALPFARVVRSRQPLHGVEQTVQLPDQRTLILSISAAPLIDEKGDLYSVVMTVDDVTERKRIERDLETSRQFLQSALDALSANIAVLDAAGTIVAVNASWCEFGARNGLLWPNCGLGRSYLAVLDAGAKSGDEGAREAVHGIREVIAGQRDVFWQEYPCHSPTEQRWYSMSVTRFEGPEGPLVVTSHENVTQRKLAELAMREAKEAAETARAEAEKARREEEARRHEAERRRRIAESLRDVLSLLNSTRSLQEVLEYIAAQASDVLANATVAIYGAADDEGTFAQQAVHAPSPACLSPGEMARAIGILRQAIAARTPLAVPDVQGAPASSTEIGPPPAYGDASAPRPHAVLAVPIVVQGTPYGGLTLCYADARPFTTEEIALAALFGDQLALAIETTRLRAQAQETAIAAERNRLARELHDAVTQTLFSASVIAETLPRIWESHPDAAQQGLDELRQLTRGALAEMRTLLLELRPAVLTEKPLEQLLRSLAEATTSRTRVPVTLDAEGSVHLPPRQQIAFYRIAQEALNNVVKHAGATGVTVRLQRSGGEVVLSIEDNGSGFDPAIARPGHLGLGIMQERAEQIGATLAVQSQPGAGTRVTVRWQWKGGVSDDN